MLLIILRRLGQSFFVLFLVALISFMMFRYVGNPVDNLLGQEATVEQREALIEALGLNDPLFIQYFDFVTRVLQFDFGKHPHHHPEKHCKKSRHQGQLEGRWKTLQNHVSNRQCAAVGITKIKL